MVVNVWDCCASSSLHLLPSAPQMHHKAPGGSGGAVRPDRQRQRRLRGPVPVRRGWAGHPQDPVPAAEAVPVHREQPRGVAINTDTDWLSVGRLD